MALRFRVQGLALAHVPLGLRRDGGLGVGGGGICAAATSRAPLDRGPGGHPRLIRTAILLGIHLKPSDFRSYAESGPVSTEVGDHLGTLGAVRFLFSLFLHLRGAHSTPPPPPPSPPLCPFPPAAPKPKPKSTPRHAPPTWRTDPPHPTPTHHERAPFSGTTIRGRVGGPGVVGGGTAIGEALFAHDWAAPTVFRADVVQCRNAGGRRK